MIKNRPFVTKKHMGTSIYVSTWLSQIRKLWKFSFGTTTLKTYVSHTGLLQTVEKLNEVLLRGCFSRFLIAQMSLKASENYVAIKVTTYLSRGSFN